MNNFTSNLLVIRERLELSQAKMADKLGIKASTYANYENGHSKPELDTFLSMAEKLEISMDDLVYKNLSEVNEGVVNDPPVKYGKPKQVGIPLIPIEAMAGDGNGDYTASMIDSNRYSVPEFNNKADFLIKIAGTSMSPKYFSGDVLACKKVPIETFIQWGKVYIMDTSQGAICKRLQKSQKGEDYVLVVSENAELYPAFDMHRKEIRALAIVIGLVRLE